MQSNLNRVQSWASLAEGAKRRPVMWQITQILYEKYAKYEHISLRRWNYSNYAPNTPQWVYSVRGDKNRKIKSSSGYQTSWQLRRNPHWLIRFHASFSMQDAIAQLYDVPAGPGAAVWRT